MNDIVIFKNLIIPESEITFSASRSSKPGGQNVNKVSTRITLNFNIHNSSVLGDEQKSIILKKLNTRINKVGVLRVNSQKHRTQKANKYATIERFCELLRDSLSRAPKRKPTKIPKPEKLKRLENKKHRSRLKQLRSKDINLEE